ncbi:MULTISPECIES: DctP family TRAP transporter solute-binding subunit [unclassified Brevibacterium]|uniref:DctP family TRAP transporter solute-binding subunit n=1 Tax=unclassified Brevibacterium TaxID=2614124 RepID=UPI0010F43F0E|nr:MULTISPECIES: DctP family TRAP transporter solute-binding subunit [unclassified Brevibacterium]MCM1011374.1 DctP family TRAP transporter solute-binding subunit [Brevibacterium sp. XM4083]
MKKRLATAITAAAAVLALSGCAMFQPVDFDRAATDAVDPNAITLRFGNVYEATHPVNSCGLEPMKEELADQGFNVLIYPAAQIGSEAEMVEQVATGALDFVNSGPSFLGAWHPEAAVLDGAFLAEDAAELQAATTGPIMTDVFDDMAAETDLRVVSNFYYGARQVTANTPVRTPEDLNGLKIRTPDAPLYLTTLDIMGATATPMALSEVYLGLQQNTIDAQENPIPTIASAKFYEVQDYISITEHIVQGVYLVGNQRLLDSMEPEKRRTLTEAIDAARVRVEECTVTQEREILAEWKETGEIEVVEDVDIQAFRDLVAAELPTRVSWGDTYLAVKKSLEDARTAAGEEN